MLQQPQLEELRAHLDKMKKSDYKIIFGHYPTGSVAVEGNLRLQDILAGQIYLCGHYHTFFNLVREMYTRYFSGLLEVELGDWKENRKFRVLALDQGQISLVDSSFLPQGPNVIILVTNPKAAHLQIPNENWNRTLRSETIRILVFSDIAIESVEVLLPDFHIFEKAKYKILPNIPFQSPLYTLNWNPEKYSSGVHDLTVRVHLKSGLVKEHCHTFSLDRSQHPYFVLSRLILMMDWYQVFAAVFGVVNVIMISTLCLLRMAHQQSLSRRSVNERKTTFRRVFWRRYWLLVAIEPLFQELVLSILFFTLIPWCIGYVLKDKLAVISPWGILLLNDPHFKYQSPDATCFIGILYTLLKICSIITLAGKVETKFKGCFDHSEKEDFDSQQSPISKLVNAFQNHVCIISLMLASTYFAYVCCCMYGFIACFSQLGIIGVFVSLHMYYRATNLSEEDFQEICYVLGSNKALKST